MEYANGITLIFFKMRITFVMLFYMVVPCSAVHAQVSKADSLTSAALGYHASSDYAAAIILFEQALHLYLQQPRKLEQSSRYSQALGTYIIALRRNGEINKAHHYLLRLDSLGVHEPFPRLNFKLKKDIGFSFRHLARFDEAIHYYKEALEYSGFFEDSTEHYSLYNSLAYPYQRKGDYATANKYLTEAAAFFKKTGNTSLYTDTMNLTFLNLMAIGLYQEAEPYIREFLTMVVKRNNLRKMDMGYHNLAWNHARQGRIDSAIIYYQKSLDLTRTHGDPYEMAATLHEISDLYSDMGRHMVARDFLAEALRVNQQTNRPAAIAFSFRKLGRNARMLDEQEQARNYLIKAYEMLGDSEPLLLAEILFELSNYERDTGNFEKAFYYLDKGDSVAWAVNTARLISEAALLKGQLFARLGKWQQSITPFKNAYLFASNNRLKTEINKELARVYYALQSDSAFHFAEEAISQINKFRTVVSGEEMRAGFFEEHARFFNEVAYWYLTLKQKPDKAFELIEAAKARALTDELAKAQNAPVNGIQGDEYIVKQQKIRHINNLYSALEMELDTERQNELKTQIRDAELEYQAYINIINLDKNTGKNFRSPEPVGVAEAQSYLDNKTAIVEFAFSGDNLLIFYITETGFQTAVIDTIGPHTALDFIATQVQELLTHIREKQPVNTIESIASGLYALLLNDFLSLNTAISNLVIVNDGPIAFLPFEVLKRNGRYLAQDYTIKYMPSVSIISFIQNPHRLNDGLMALAGANFSPAESAPIQRSVTYASLPSTLIEVEAIAKNFSETNIIKDTRLQQIDLKQERLQDYRFLHFATHGRIDLENPARSGLLINTGGAKNDDGFLNSNEISLLNLNADLVVLSACKTGIGRLISGEGLAGLQRSFLIAGASAVVVSLWDIYDKSTSVFMDDFYRTMLLYQKQEYSWLSRSLNFFGLYTHPLIDYKARALQQAKINMIEHPYYNHPVYWSSFILIGK